MALCIAVAAAVCVLLIVLGLYVARNSPDPFGLKREIKVMIFIGGVPGSIGFVVGSAHGVARSIRHLLGRLRRRHHPERPRGATRRGADQSSPTSPQQQGQILKRPNMKEKFAEHLKSELGYEFTDEIDAFGRQT